MLPRQIAIAIGIFLAATVGCGDDQPSVDEDARPPGYCDALTPCTLDARPFCDLDGLFPGSGNTPNTCIAKPATVECSIGSECSDEATPQCTSAGVCVECLNFSHCNTTNPLCSLSTNTCGGCRFGDEGNSICLAIDPFQPFCAASGSCVECLDNSVCEVISAPVCDLSSFGCRGCLSSDECDAGTCNTISGVCETL